MMPSAIRTILLALLATFAVAGAAHADAEYHVVQCDNAPHDFQVYASHTAFYAVDQCAAGALSLRATPGAHSPVDGGVWWLASAPDGTTFSRWQAAFQGGAGSGAGILLSARVCADVYCFFPISHPFWGMENWGSPKDILWTGGGATMLQFGLACSFGGQNGCVIGGAPPGIDMFAPRISLVDHHAPAAPQVAGGTLPAPGWVNGRAAHSVAYTASDRGAGIERVAVTTSTGASWGQSAPCWRGPAGFSRFVPCPLVHGGSIPVNLTGLADGRHDLAVTAVDAAGQHNTAGPFPIHVDSTPPAAPRALAVVGGEGWRQRDGFGVRWSNPSELHAPIAAAHWQLCGAGGVCRSGQTRAAGITGLDGLLTGAPGDYVLRVWLEDAAGNASAANASTPVHLRVDTTPPRPVFDPRDLQNPLRVSVSVEGDLSGLAAGAVEMRPKGTDVWHALATTVEGGRLAATLDDESMPAGEYDLRARAVDAAGNEGSTDRDRDGRAVSVTLPIRIVTKLRAGHRTVRVRRVRTGRKGRRVERRIETLRARVVRAPGRAVPLEGMFTTGDDRPVPDAEIAVQQSSARDGGTFETVEAVRTDAEGRFRYRTRASRSRIVRFRYAGSTHVRGSTADVAVGARATSTIRTSDGSVLNGESIVLRGRVATVPVPANGKLVEVQAHFRDKWRTFSTVRTDRRGRWLLPYQFGGTLGTVRYRFRVRLPAEGGYDFETGTSPVKSVTVHGS